MSVPPAAGAALRAMGPADHAAVLELNADNVAALAPMDEARLLTLLGWTDRADVVEVAGQVAGFVLTFAPGTDYDSLNYRAISDRFGSDFYYLDRVAVSSAFRRRGLASLIYDQIEAVARPYGRLTLEVNSIPANDVSLAFHHSRGYLPFGYLGDQDKQVVLLAKDLT